MDSLVADYASDDSSDNAHDEHEISHPINAVKEFKGNFFSTENDLDDSDGDEIEETETEQIQEDQNRLPNPLSNKLPGPSLGTDSGSASVFTNPFEIAEKSKHSILEQHVKMTERKVPKSGKQVCFKFKKGKCRMGKSCRFSHDIDSNVAVITPRQEENNESFSKSSLVSHSVHTGQVNDNDTDDSYMATVKRKKKVGVSATLLPPKRAMIALEKERERERPWTIQQ